MNTTSLCTKRLLSEIDKLQKEPMEDVDVIIDEDNILIWYFLIKGKDEYEGGYYIGQITNSKGYPMEPPTFMMMTPSGRFDIGEKICLSNSSYHYESWSPLWTMRSVIIGFVSIMYDYSTYAFGLGHLKTTKNEKKLYAENSIDFNKIQYPDLFLKFTRFVNLDGTIKDKFLEHFDETLKETDDKLKKLKKLTEFVYL